MKLIIRQYLSSLKERGELDAVLPDLLSQLGLNVFSRPARGTRQDGVDVGAVGSLDGGPEKVYLFSIKPGDLTRRDWDGESAQSLRPSLNEILDSYIPNRLPVEHRGKEIVICIALGGDVQEQVRSSLAGFTAQNSKPNLTFEEWNGDKLANYIQASFLREGLLPEHARSDLRKSLAMLDEPDVSFRHVADLIRSLSNREGLTDAQRITAIRQMSICLWILYAWAREADNIESAYRAGEFALLHGWSVAKSFAGEDTKTAHAVTAAFFSIFSAYQRICTEFLRTNVLPYVDKLHAVSIAVRGSCSLDVNLKLFDLLGRLAVSGLWASWGAQRCTEEDGEAKNAMLAEADMSAKALIFLVHNNPVLMLPVKEEQAIDVCIACSLLMLTGNRPFVQRWLAEMLDRAMLAFESHSTYPCVLRTYSELLGHPKSRDAEYRANATSGSILYPVIALWAALLDDEETYAKVSAMKRELMAHCTFQFWYPDEQSEAHFYTNSDIHGAALPHLAIDRSKEEFLEQVFGECNQSPHFQELSAVKSGWGLLIIVACRHFRLPIPLHLLEGLRRPVDASGGEEDTSKAEPNPDYHACKPRERIEMPARC